MLDESTGGRIVPLRVDLLRIGLLQDRQDLLCEDFTELSTSVGEESGIDQYTVHLSADSSHRSASVLTSTPIWSKELMPQTKPCTATLCS